MRNQIILICLIAVGLTAGTSRLAADEAKTNAAPVQLTREQWQKLTPEEREVRIKALREQRSSASGQSATGLREELRALPPAEREAKLQEWRTQRGLPPMTPEQQKLRGEWQKLTPEERQAKLEELRKKRPATAPVDEKAREQRRAALEQKLAELRARKAEGKLTPQEENRLQELERAERLLQARPGATKPAETPAAEDGKKP